MIRYPDYDNSILTIPSSVLKHYGASYRHAGHSLLDEILSKNHKNVVVMLFDGLGTAILAKHLPENSFLRRNQKTTLTSVFPATTAAATVSLETGLSPIEHGWLGWSLYFSEINANVNVFPNTLSGNSSIQAADYQVAERYLPFQTIFEKISIATNGTVLCEGVSPFSAQPCHSSAEICNAVKTICSGEGKKFVYSYWFQPDDHMHDYGTEHELIHNEIQTINNEVESMCSELSDTLVIITADHGMIDTNWRYLANYPDIQKYLLRMPSIEARAISFFIKNGDQEAFEDAFQKAFGDCYLLLSKEEVLKRNLFGSGIPHPRSDGFIGDYMAIATSDTSLEINVSKKSNLFKAAHAGLTEEEMIVPLILIDKAK